jgi:tRNA threonylcarbamoyl adenosine modification protein (Sua5/YciO/YrdC/YwlC family)
VSKHDLAGSLERCVRDGGVVVFPSDTVYGLACSPSDPRAVGRLYGLKRRPLTKASAVMFFDLEAALAALPELGPCTRGALRRLLPGGLTTLLPNPDRRFVLACGEDHQTLGLRVPVVPSLAGVRGAVLQSSANLAGGPDPRRVDDVPEVIRTGADLVIDGGELPGTASTVLDLRSYEAEGAWTVVRVGAVAEEALAAALDWQDHFDPGTYGEMIRADLPGFDRLQERLVAESGRGAQRILELGTGTGETARRLLARHPEATLVGIDVSEPMLAAARALLPADRVSLRVGRLQEPLPPGPFDLVASALCVHHLTGNQKAGLFRRIREVLAPGGRFALADVVLPEDPADAVSALTPGYDKPSPLTEQLEWLAAAGLHACVPWRSADLAVVVARSPT